MASDADTTRLRAARVLLILGVLASLCVSDGVGPRLLPLPPLAERVAAFTVSDRGQDASHAPAHGSAVVERVEMVSAPQSRAGAERHAPQAAAHPTKFELVAPSASRTRRQSYPPLSESSTPFSRPKGRAPPRLV